VDDDAERVARAAGAAEREGALLETFTAPLISLPFEPGAFDVVVLFRQVRPLESASQAVVGEAARVVREGGRCVAIEGGTKGALARLLSAGRAVDAGAVEAAMKNAGLRGVRTLADRGGLLFVEGARRS
jgi:SAM-dependent methyltransferase